MPTDPFAKLTARSRLKCQLNYWQDILLRPWRPSHISARRSGPPNLLLIGVDTLRADHLGLGGYQEPTSPNLDRLATNGIVFTDVTAPAPWTLPSFASALTAQMPGLHGAYLSGQSRNMDDQPPTRLSENIPTLATHLRSLGYRTAAFYSNQFFAFGLAESFDEHTYANLPAQGLTRMAGEWIRRHADQPFFCFVLLNDPHEPTTPDGTDLAPFLPRLAASGIDTTPENLRQYARWGTDTGSNLTRASVPRDSTVRRALALKLAVYDATVHYVDRCINDINSYVNTIGLSDNTIISVFSDHGEEFLDHDIFSHLWNHDPRGIHGIGHGHTQFQELLHVPWVTWGPGVPAGTRIDHPVSLLDLSPTILSWLGLPPLNPQAGSENFSTHLVGQSGLEPRSLVLSEAMAYGPDLVALRRGPIKLIAHRDGRPLALFDLKQDPQEQRDLAADRPDDVVRLLTDLSQWRDSGHGATGKEGGRWEDMEDTVRRRLKDLGYSD